MHPPRALLSSEDFGSRVERDGGCHPVHRGEWPRLANAAVDRSGLVGLSVLSGLVQVRASHGFYRPHEPEEPDREAGQEKLRFRSATLRMGGHPGRGSEPRTALVGSLYRTLIPCLRLVSHHVLSRRHPWA